MSSQSSASPTASEYPQFTNDEKDWMACMFYHPKEYDENFYRAVVYVTPDRIIPAYLLRTERRNEDRAIGFLHDVRRTASGADQEYFRRWNVEGEEDLHPALHDPRDMRMARFNAGRKNYS
ncbi:MAG: hypothetical protein Q9171_004273 [Xanthocarpia ochracea]